MKFCSWMRTTFKTLKQRMHSLPFLNSEKKKIILSLISSNSSNTSKHSTLSIVYSVIYALFIIYSFHRILVKFSFEYIHSGVLKIEQFSSLTATFSLQNETEDRPKQSIRNAHVYNIVAWCIFICPEKDQLTLFIYNSLLFVHPFYDLHSEWLGCKISTMVWTRTMKFKCSISGSQFHIFVFFLYALFFVFRCRFSSFLNYFFFSPVSIAFASAEWMQ